MTITTIICTFHFYSKIITIIILTADLGLIPSQMKFNNISEKSFNINSPIFYLGFKMLCYFTEANQQENEVELLRV